MEEERKAGREGRREGGRKTFETIMGDTFSKSMLDGKP
jgi:hypothetical protein